MIALAAADVAIQQVVARWQRNLASDIVNMQIEIADRQVTLAEQLEEHAERFWPKEIDILNDTFDEPKRETQYAPMMLQYDGLYEEKIEDGRQDWLGSTRQQCLGTDDCFNARWQRNSIMMRVDAMSYAARQDENRTEVFNEFRYAKQQHILGYGKGIMATMDRAYNIGVFAATNAAGILAGAVNGALSLYGYATERFTGSLGWGAGARDQLLRRAPEAGVLQSGQHSDMRTQRGPLSSVFGPIGGQLINRPREGVSADNRIDPSLIGVL